MAGRKRKALASCASSTDVLVESQHMEFVDRMDTRGRRATPIREQSEKSDVAVTDLPVPAAAPKRKIIGSSQREKYCNKKASPEQEGCEGVLVPVCGQWTD